MVPMSCYVPDDADDDCDGDGCDDVLKPTCKQLCITWPGTTSPHLLHVVANFAKRRLPTTGHDLGATPGLVQHGIFHIVELQIFLTSAAISANLERACTFIQDLGQQNAAMFLVQLAPCPRHEELNPW